MNNIKRLVIVHAPTSTRAKKYDSVYAELKSIASSRGWNLTEIELRDLPYFQAVGVVLTKLQLYDLVIAAGGDGTAQVVANAVYLAKSDNIIYTTIPLGNGNDISRAINKRNRSVKTIFNQPITDFYPLNIVVNGKLTFSLMSYVTFGATTVLVDYLNQGNSRKLRKVLKNLSPAVSLPIGSVGEISNKISQLNFPDFQRDNKKMTDDSIGFFLIPAAHNVLRLPKDITWASSEFFFHYCQTKNKNLAKKIVMAGAWTIHFPGEMTELEELTFADNNTNIVANVSGDNINLGQVKSIAAIRSIRPIKILANK